MINDPIQENNDLNIVKKSDNDWWKPAMFFYSKVTSWIIVPVIVAVIFNKYVLTGNNLLFFVLIFIGFVVTCYGIYREIKIYKKDIDQQDKDNKKNGNQ